MHMLQHLLIGDLAPLLLALGLSGPLLRPLLAPKPVQRLQVLTHPLVALPLWALNLCVWHLPVLYDAALDHPLVHALQHVCFLTGGLLLWSTLLGLLPGPRWYGLGARFASLGVRLGRRRGARERLPLERHRVLLGRTCTRRAPGACPRSTTSAPAAA